MPINTVPLAVLDFETTGLDVKTVDPTQIACCVFDPRTLKEIDCFNSYMKPTTDPSTWSDKALEVTRLTKEQILEFPPQEQVFKLFIEWINKHKKGNRFDQRPILCGQNVIMYDLPIFQRLCEKYGYVDKEGQQNVFNKRTMLDTLHVSFLWLESNNEIQSYSFDAIRDYFGMSKENAHNALTDVKQTGEYLMRFLRFHRELVKGKKVQFKDSFKNQENGLTSPSEVV